MGTIVFLMASTSGNEEARRTWTGCFTCWAAAPDLSPRDMGTLEHIAGHQAQTEPQNLLEELMTVLPRVFHTRASQSDASRAAEASCSTQKGQASQPELPSFKEKLQSWILCEVSHLKMLSLNVFRILCMSSKTCHTLVHYNQLRALFYMNLKWLDTFFK